MDIKAGDRLYMKKQHPCGGHIFLALRVGMDFKLKCMQCGRMVELPRGRAEKAVKRILSAEE